MTTVDAIVIGAGPTGLACGLELQKRGVTVLLLDKGCVVNSIYNYPTHMTFFTTPELLEIGDIPMTSLNDKPTRGEALKYYRRVAAHYKLNIHQDEGVDSFSGHDGDFTVHTPKATYQAKKMVIASGYYDVPNLLNCPGEDLPKVAHYYTEPHPYFDHDVLVVGHRLTWAPFIFFFSALLACFFRFLSPLHSLQSRAPRILHVNGGPNGQTMIAQTDTVHGRQIYDSHTRARA